MNIIHTDAVTDVVNHNSVTITNVIFGVHLQNLLQPKNIDCLDKPGQFCLNYVQNGVAVSICIGRIDENVRV